MLRAHAEPTARVAAALGGPALHGPALLRRQTGAGFRPSGIHPRVGKGTPRIGSRADRDTALRLAAIPRCCAVASRMGEFEDTAVPRDPSNTVGLGAKPRRGSRRLRLLILLRSWFVRATERACDGRHHAVCRHRQPFERRRIRVGCLRCSGPGDVRDNHCERRERNAQADGEPNSRHAALRGRWLRRWAHGSSRSTRGRSQCEREGPSSEGLACVSAFNRRRMTRASDRVSCGPRPRSGRLATCFVAPPRRRGGYSGAPLPPWKLARKDRGS